MDFEFTDSLWIAESDLDEMCRLCREEDYSAEDALYVVAVNWSSRNYYKVRMVEDKIVTEINRKLGLDK